MYDTDCEFSVQSDNPRQSVVQTSGQHHGFDGFMDDTDVNSPCNPVIRGNPWFRHPLASTHQNCQTPSIVVTIVVLAETNPSTRSRDT